MDTKASEIIVQTFREGRFTAPEGSTLQEEMQEALPRLNGLLFALVGLELGEHYRDWPVPPGRTSTVAARYPRAPLAEDLTSAQYTNPPPNVRILASNTSALTVYFPQEPQDGARMAYADVGATADVTLDGNGRLIQGVPSILGQGGFRKWLYRADQGNWICLDTLQMDDTSPLPPEFDDLLICGLVMRLSPRFGKEPSPILTGRYDDMLRRLKLRYKQSEQVPASDASLGVDAANVQSPRPWDV